MLVRVAVVGFFCVFVVDVVVVCVHFSHYVNQILGHVFAI